MTVDFSPTEDEEKAGDSLAQEQSGYCDWLFSLATTLSDGKRLVVHAYDRNVVSGSHHRVDFACILGNTTIFSIGDSYVGIPSHKTIDGNFAKECLLKLLGMKFGDTDDDFFSGYTGAQIDFMKYAEEIDSLREIAFCDENGNLLEE